MKIGVVLLCAIVLELFPSAASSDTGNLPQYNFNQDAGYIHATGSWIGDSPGSGDPYFKDFVIQTSEIACYKTRGVCLEARAVSKGPVMYSNLIEYKIVEWNSDVLTAMLEGTAATIEFNVDLKKKRVFLITKQKHDVGGRNHLPDHAHLDDGVKAIQRASGR